MAGAQKKAPVWRGLGDAVGNCWRVTGWIGNRAKQVYAERRGISPPVAPLCPGGSLGAPVPHKPQPYHSRMHGEADFHDFHIGHLP
jgi:hypothetical protein